MIKTEPNQPRSRIRIALVLLYSAFVLLLLSVNVWYYRYSWRELRKEKEGTAASSVYLIPALEKIKLSNLSLCKKGPVKVYLNWTSIKKQKQFVQDTIYDNLSFSMAGCDYRYHDYESLTFEHGVGVYPDAKVEDLSPKTAHKEEYMLALVFEQ